ncbi:MAG: type II toxin-antitoxin system RelE/ParE family toxin [Acidobacteria bacterium]|nr:type II toxin-antitoxin system RelE/ParE family toxin [Acidobacteriota bacterium]
MRYTVEITPTALDQLRRIEDRRVRGLLVKRIDRLAENPGQQGKELHGELRGLRSVRAAGQRYRILYRIEGATVTGVAVGRRKEGDRSDIYRLARTLLRLRLAPPGE